MKELVRTFCICISLMGMITTCSGHHGFEEIKFEVEESELEDCLTRRDENESHSRRMRAMRTGFQPFWLEGKSELRLLIKPPLNSLSERDRFNGLGAFLLI